MHDFVVDLEQLARRENFLFLFRTGVITQWSVIESDQIHPPIS